MMIDDNPHPDPPSPSYYRGYRLLSSREGVQVWYVNDLVETVASTAIAHEHIDSWQDAP